MVNRCPKNTVRPQIVSTPFLFSGCYSFLEDLKLISMDFSAQKNPQNSIFSQILTCPYFAIIFLKNSYSWDFYSYIPDERLFKSSSSNSNKNWSSSRQQTGYKYSHLWSYTLEHLITVLSLLFDHATLESTFKDVLSVSWILRKQEQVVRCCN